MVTGTCNCKVNANSVPTGGPPHASFTPIVILYLEGNTVEFNLITPRASLSVPEVISVLVALKNAGPFPFVDKSAPFG